MLSNYICLDKYGIPINEFIFNENGTVSGINALDTTESLYGSHSSHGPAYYEGEVKPTQLSRECCLNFNFRYDDDTGFCYYTDACQTSDPLKLIFGADDNNPVLFEVENAQGDLNEEQEKNCVRQIAELEKELANLNETLNGYYTTLSDINGRNNDLNLKISSSSISLSDGQITKGTAPMPQYESQISVIENQIILIQEQIAELEEELVGLNEVCNPIPPPCNLDISFDYLWNFDCEKLLNCGTGDSSYISELKLQLAVCNEEVTTFEEEIITINSRLSGLASEITNGQNQINVLEDELDGLIDPIRIYEIEIEIQNINQELSGYANQYSNYQIELNEVQNELSTQQDVCAQIQIMIDNINNNGNLLQTLEDVTFYLTIEKRVTDQNTGQSTWETAYEEEFFNIDNLLGHITNNNQTGIYFSGDKCDDLIENISIQLGENCDVINDNTFNSNWLNMSTTITPSTVWNGNNVLLEIVNEYITFGIKVEYNNSNCEYCILMDRIRMDKSCEETEKVETLVNRCPGFELKRVIDNKKSWMDITSGHTRDFDLISRNTEYKTPHHKAIINSKEIDLEVEPAHAIELDLFNYTNQNGCILSGTTGQTNYLEYINSDISEINSIDEFNYVLNTELIDAKSNKVLQSYPVLRAIYDRYISPFEYGCTGTTSNGYTYCDLIDFSKLLGIYWIDLIEQVIPSTTIWGSVYRYSNTIFDTNKFQYKRYSVDYCPKDKLICDWNYGETNIPEVIAEDLSKENESEFPDCFIASNETRICNRIRTNDYSDSCEYHGRVYVINSSGVSISPKPPFFPIPIDIDIDSLNIDDGTTIIMNEDINYYDN